MDIDTLKLELLERIALLDYPERLLALKRDDGQPSSYVRVLSGMRPVHDQRSFDGEERTNGCINKRGITIQRTAQ